MKDRFDLEADIMMTYNFVHQLRSLSKGVLEKELDKDKIANAIEGLAILIDLHTDDIYDTFTECFQLNEYANTTDLFDKRNHVI